MLDIVSKAAASFLNESILYGVFGSIKGISWFSSVTIKIACPYCCSGQPPTVNSIASN